MPIVTSFGQAVFLSVMFCAACVVYLVPLQHRPMVVVRAVASLLVCGAGYYALSAFTLLGGWLNLFACFGLVVAVLLVCCDIGWRSALYCGVWVYVTHQLTAELWLLGSGFEAEPQIPLHTYWLLGTMLFLVVYITASLTIARWMPQDGDYHVGPRQLTAALVLLVLFELILQLLYSRSHDDYVYRLTVILAQFCCVTILYLQQALFRKSAIQQELDILNRMQYEQKQQYAIAKDTIAVINRKCHDLKHQVAAMRHMTDSTERDAYLQEIEDSVRIYEAIVQTGNEVLDTVLTEKSLYCEANQITVNCVADGSSLGFMAPVDIYAMLGNALDNAIENVQDFSQLERRFIDVLVSCDRQFLVIQVINPLMGVLDFEDGLPRSTKPSDGYHGFGLKSIRHTAQQYGGSLLVEQRGGCFCLKIVIPIPQ